MRLYRTGKASQLLGISKRIGLAKNTEFLKVKSKEFLRGKSPIRLSFTPES